MRLLLPAILALIAAPAAAAPDWTRTITVKPDGAHVMGDPRARTRIVEYVSYTCSHCAAFVKEGSEPLRAGWVRPGSASVELRHAIRDPYDLTAALLARCGGAQRFFGDHEAIFAQQEAWLPRVEAYEEKRQAGRTPGGDAALPDIAQATGLFALMAKRGLAEARARQCLGDKAAIERLGAMAKDAWGTRKIGGTPTFSIDGRLVEAHDWAGLRAQLPQPRN